MEKKIKFKVLSRAMAEAEWVQKSITEPHILISINGTTGTDSTSAIIPANQYRKELLHIQFDDIDNSKPELTQGMIPFTEDHARNILNFVEKNINDIDLIVVHCFAGVCRSVAVAASLSKIINNEDDVLFKSGVPNMLVYREMLDKYFLEDNFHLIWKDIYLVRDGNLKPI